MKKYGIIGYPLAQSASPKFFNEKFAAEGIDARYIPFEIESTDELPHIIEQHPELCGFNVTIPHKLNVMQYLAGISDEAKAINAVNVVKVMRDSNGKAQLWGYNSDVIGFSRSIQPLLGNHHKKALVLGTGGASKAIVYALEKLGIEVDISEENVMKIRGGEIHPATTFSHDDHRIAMSLAVSALRCNGEVKIENAECVEKSYPTFFEDLDSIIVR